MVCIPIGKTIVMRMVLMCVHTKNSILHYVRINANKT